MAATHGSAGRSRRFYGVVGQLLGSFGLNVGGSTSEIVVASYTLPKGALETAGQGLRISASAAWVSSANSKTMRIRLNGLTGNILAVLVGTTTNGVALQTVVRRAASATTFVASGFGIGDGTTAAVTSVTNLLSTTIANSGNFDTGNVTIDVTLVNATASETFLRSFQVELLPETPNPADGGVALP